LFSLQKISVSLFIAFLSFSASAGDPYFLPAGARQAGMSYTCVMKNEFWSLFHNQAGFALNHSPAFGFNYENRFGIKELSTRSAAIVIPAGNAGIGALYSYFGYPDFRRQMAGIACGLSLSEKISAGIQIDYFSEKTYGEYNDYNMLTFETGLLIRASENTMMGIHIFNPVPNSIRKTDMITALRIGAGTKLNRDLFTGIEVEMITDGKINLKTGLEYEAGKKLWLRTGFCSANSSFSFGLGYDIIPVRVDLAFVTHQNLGITTSVSIIFKIRE
jgi:hypothetical protein